jgi:hypothetical protein
VEAEWIIHDRQYHFWYADHVPWDFWEIFQVREPALLILIREIKLSFIKCDNVLPTLVRDELEEFQEIF